ncbi:MAG: hypothetical protein SPI77_02470 [Corynebacterium sp.]|nr:hypothetical protein [Corynebacterium sp.]
MALTRGEILKQQVSLQSQRGMVNVDGVWVSPEVAAACTQREHVHLLKIAAVAQTYQNVVIAGASSLIACGIPVPDVPAQVDVFLPGRRGGDRKHVVQFRTHKQCSFTRQYEDLSGLRVSPVGEATFDALRWGPQRLDTAVALLDSVSYVTSTPLLFFQSVYQRQVAAHRRYRRLYIDRALELACVNVQSIRESMLRMALYERGYPAPIVQTRLFSHRQQWLGQPDLFYREVRVALEYDGQGKFHGEFGKDPLQAMSDHRHRSDQIAAMDVRMLHVDSQSWREDAWVPQLDEALRRTCDPFPESLMAGGRVAWDRRFDIWPMNRWKMDYS